jgi:hypothetical protein
MLGDMVQVTRICYLHGTFVKRLLKGHHFLLRVGVDTAFQPGKHLQVKKLNLRGRRYRTLVDNVRLTSAFQMLHSWFLVRGADVGCRRDCAKSVLGGVHVLVVHR